MLEITTCQNWLPSKNTTVKNEGGTKYKIYNTTLVYLFIYLLDEVKIGKQ